MAQAANRDFPRLAGGTPKARARARSMPASHAIEEIAAHLTAARRLAEAHPDADLHYLLSDALMYVGQQMTKLDGQPADGSSAD